MHLTRRRKADVSAVVNINGFSGEPLKELRVLGCYVDPQLKWTRHITKVTEEGMDRLKSLSRIAGSTWGPSFARTRLLYMTTIRSAILQASPVWSIGDSGKGQSATALQPLCLLQNKCLRLISGAYKHAPVAALEREIDVPPLPLSLQA